MVGREGIEPGVATAIDQPSHTLLPLAHTLLSHPTHRGPHCVALHPFTAEGEGELSIVSGDTIELLEKVGTNWLKGRKGQAIGIFPSQFVEIKVDLPPPSKVTVPGSGSKSKGISCFSKIEQSIRY